MTTQFQVGQTYATRSICDYDTIFSFTILARSAKMVTINWNGRNTARRVFDLDGKEAFRPHGNYSFATIICADKTLAAVQASR
jgi:hypothetical protein